MKSQVCILVLLIISQAHSWACSISGSAPTDYMYYRACNTTKQPYFGAPLYGARNIASWRAWAGEHISSADIQEVVYKYSCQDMQSYMRKPNSIPDNDFAKHIFESQPAAAQLLLIAKQVELARSTQYDPWYYPASKDEGYAPLESLLKEIDQYEDELKASNDDARFYLERLQLQRIRVLFSMGQYEDCIYLWESKIQDWEADNLMRTMIKDYIAGAYEHIGQREKAEQYYLEQNNLHGLMLLYANKYRSYADFVRALYDHDPDCAEIVAPVMQYELYRIIGRDYSSATDIACCEEYYEVMQYIIRTQRSQDMALWYYTAACIEEHMGYLYKAAQSIRKAAQYPCNEDLSSSIRMLRIYIDSQTKPYDASYEQQLYADLRWMDQMIKADTARLRDDWDSYRIWQIWSNSSMGYGSHCKEYICYPYTMLRKIILTEVAPRMKQVQKTTLSIALTNYADNMLLMLMDRESCQCYFNNFFMAMDTISAADVERYARRALNPSTSLERFLAAGGYVDKDYLYDIVGTLYLRERKYQNAMETLSRVAPKYQNKLNTNPNLQKDPFCFTDNVNASDSLDAKYRFACRMRENQHIFENDGIDPNRRADAMLSYAVGMHNSYLRVWGLTQYGQGQVVFLDAYKPWLTKQREEQIQKDYQHMVSQAFATYTDDEMAVDAHLRYMNNYTIVTKYPNTEAAKMLRGQCDTYYDYMPKY